MAMPYYYPTGYQPYYNPYQIQNQQIQNQQVSQQTMTPPTIHADIIQIDGEEAANKYPVGAGESQMMMARDESAIYIKSATQNGQCKLDVFIKRPPKPEKPEFNPAEYVRRDEMESILNTFMSSHSTQKTKKGVSEQ